MSVVARHAAHDGINALSARLCPPARVPVVTFPPLKYLASTLMPQLKQQVCCIQHPADKQAEAADLLKQSSQQLQHPHFLTAGMLVVGLRGPSFGRGQVPELQANATLGSCACLGRYNNQVLHPVQERA